MGDSGSGKSTLLNILLGLITPTHGKIYVDEQELSKDFSKDYLNKISYVPQSPLILENSILENITLSKSTVSNQNKIETLLDAFDLTSVIDKLPNKLNTYIGNNGHNLSGGQKQRIALIRALLVLPDILILDEATNELDSASELLVFEYIKNLSAEHNCTVLIVSHNEGNLYSICDTVYQFDDTSLKKVYEV